MGTAGVVGLGNMGSELAANLIATGHDVVTHDVAGSARSPEGAVFVATLGELADRADVVVLSLPNGSVSRQVCEAIAAASPRHVATVVDTSTIGVATARIIADLLAPDHIGYVDAPVSGGPAGARARTLSVMYAGSPSACTSAADVLAGLSDRRHRVGDHAGMGQALKLANNFLSATALAATSEAIAFGMSVGLDMETMLEVLNSSSGQSAATTDKFVNHVLTGRYASGFANSLMAKDLRLYVDAIADQGSPSEFGRVTAGVWERFASDQPGVDFTRIYPFVSERGEGGE